MKKLSLHWGNKKVFMKASPFYAPQFQKCNAVLVAILGYSPAQFRKVKTKCQSLMRKPKRGYSQSCYSSACLSYLNSYSKVVSGEPRSAGVQL